MSEQAPKVVRATVHIECADGTWWDMELLDHPRHQLIANLGWERPPVEVPKRTDFSPWKVFEPGPHMFASVELRGLAATYERSKPEDRVEGART